MGSEISTYVPWDYSSKDMDKCDLCGVTNRKEHIMIVSNESASMKICKDRQFCLKACGHKASRG